MGASLVPAVGLWAPAPSRPGWACWPRPLLPSTPSSSGSPSTSGPRPSSSPVPLGPRARLASDERRLVGPALAGGVLCGLAALTRETALPVAPLAALWLAWPGRVPRRGCGERPSSWPPCSPSCPGRRATGVFHAFVPVSTFGPLNLWQGNAGLDRDEIYRQSDAVEGPIAEYRLAWTRAREVIGARQPAWIIEKLEAELPAFFEPWSEALSFIADGVYGPVGPMGRRIAQGLLPGALRGLAAGRAGAGALCLDSAPGPAWLFFRLLRRPHVVAYGAHRFHLPLVPILLLWADRPLDGGAAGERRLGLR